MGMKVLKRKDGFTMVELMVVMAITVFVLAAASQVLIALITQFKQQSKIAESSVESTFGLGIMRYDIKTGGFGLPWEIDSAVNYSEAVNDGTRLPASFNDGGSTAPRSFVLGSTTGMLNTITGTDYLAVKSILAASTAGNEAAGKWHTFILDKDLNEIINTWNPTTSGDNLADTDRVMVLKMDDNIELVNNGSAFSTTFSTIKGGGSGYEPTERADVRVIYGVTDGTSPRMPFNRADYFISTNDVPMRCAPNTGVLVKAIVNQSDGKLGTELPLLDCVADMQVTFWWDTDGDEQVDWPPTDSVGSKTAEEIREQLMEVRVYVLAHEGQKDTTYDFSQNGTRTALSMIESYGPNSRTVNFKNLQTNIGDPDYEYYRWRIYRLSESPNSME